MFDWFRNWGARSRQAYRRRLCIKKAGLRARIEATSLMMNRLKEYPYSYPQEIIDNTQRIAEIDQKLKDMEEDSK